MASQAAVKYFYCQSFVAKYEVLAAEKYAQ